MLKLVLEVEILSGPGLVSKTERKAAGTAQGVNVMTNKNTGGSGVHGVVLKSWRAICPTSEDIICHVTL